MFLELCNYELKNYKFPNSFFKHILLRYIPTQVKKMKMIPRNENDTKNNNFKWYKSPSFNILLLID